MKRISQILIVAATEFELKNVLRKLNFVSENNIVKSYRFENLNTDVLISGIGIPLTTYKLTKALSEKKYDLVINAGICGSFNKILKNGTCLNVTQDEFADFGITDAENTFKTLFEENFISKNELPFSNGKLISKKLTFNCNLHQVSGITVNSTSGNAEQIRLRKEKFNADVETMEGAAVAYVCLSENVDYLQIRSVSNPVEPRNKDNWDISLAINNLTEAIINILQSIKTQL